MRNQKRTKMALLLLVNSHRIFKQGQMDGQFQTELAPFKDSIWDQFYSIFNDNSLHRREAFFQEPLIEFLWTKYRRHCAKEIRQTINELNFSDRGSKPEQKTRFLAEVKRMENLVGFKIIS